jgi:hypothetical protein
LEENTALVFRRWQAEQLFLPPAFALISCLAYSSTMKMEAICSSETIQSYIPDGNNSLMKIVGATFENNSIL